MLTSVLLLCIYFAAWAGVHSLLASRPVKDFARRSFGVGVERYYRLGYVLVAVVTFLPVVPLVFYLPDQILYVAPRPWIWLMLVGQGLALLLSAGVVWQQGPWTFLGLAQLLDVRPPRQIAMHTGGFYRLVRHPLYLFGLILIWLTPVMTLNLLIAYLSITLYLFLGARHEESRLLAEYGEIYRAYQRRVPAILPWPRRRG